MSRIEPMSPQLPKTEEEWYTRCEAFLQELGVSDPEPGESGSIPVSPGSREVQDLKVSENTSTRQQVLNQFPRDPEERLLVGGPKVMGNYGNPICNNLRCRIISRLPRECSYIETSWIDPEIVANALPNEVPEATAYLNPFNARIEGEAEFEMDNNSEPGQKVTQKIYKCQQNGPKQYETKEQSAVLDGENSGDFIDRTADETVDSLTHSWADVDYGSSATATVTFEKSGALNVIEALYYAWTRGYMEARAEATLDVTYQWRGSSKTRSFDTTANIRIPVTNLNYSW